MVNTSERDAGICVTTSIPYGGARKDRQECLSYKMRGNRRGYGSIIACHIATVLPSGSAKIVNQPMPGTSCFET